MMCAFPPILACWKVGARVQAGTELDLWIRLGSGWLLRL